MSGCPSNFDNPITRDSAESIFISEYVAPWALPKEEIPIHLIWNPCLKFDLIRITLPSSMSVREFYNVASYEKLDSAIIVKKLKSHTFLGFVVALDEIIKEPHEKREIAVDFILGDTVARSHSFIANIYRPKLSLVSDPSPVILRDDSNIRDLLNLSLQISGFGNIEVMTELSIGGKFRTNLEPLYQEMTRRLITSLRSKEQHTDKKKSVQIDSADLHKMAEDFINRVRRGELSLNLTGDELAEFSAWVNSEPNYDKIRDLVSEHLENILIDSLLYYLEKFPAEGVKLSGGNPALIITSEIQTIKLRFRYRDSLHNEYEPVLVKIPVEDLRSNKLKGLKMPINIKWSREQINPIEESVKCK